MADNSFMSPCRQCRAENTKLFLKGDRCLTAKCPIVKKKKFVGKGRRGKTSYYGLQLREKQKLKRFYGLSESQFKKCYEMANHAAGNTGEMLFQFLERRLDNLVYRSGFAVSRPQARQMVNHGLFMVNDRVCDIPSYLLQKGDQISLRDSKKQLTIIEGNLNREYQIPEWISKKDNFHVEIMSFPLREDITDLEVKEQLIIELYSR
jgi:small subunit ribosomal protein S4